MREPKIKIEKISSNGNILTNFTQWYKNETILIIVHFYIKDKENVDPNNQAEFQIDWEKYPLSLAGNDPNVKDELDSIINKKHECYYTTESS